MSLKFGIVSDPYKDPGFKVLHRVTEILRSEGHEVVYPGTRNGDSEYDTPFSGDSWQGVDLALSLGGDGTFLYTCHQVYQHDIPLIGVNLGSMGFMTEIEAEDLEEALTRLGKGDYRIRNRMMLKVQVHSSSEPEVLDLYALNDVVLYRGAISRIIPCTFTLNGTKIETIPSDGLILAGPTGSTGYALACGGPIIEPQLELMLLTPISPHTLHNRSYIIDPDSVVEIGIEEEYPFRPQVTIDGHTVVDVGAEDRVIVRKADRPIRLANLDAYNFFHRLPAKISARGKAR